MAKKLGARGTLSLGYFRDPELDWLLKRVLIAASEQGAEIGECLYAAGRVHPRRPDTWVHAWEELGDRLVSQADASRDAGHPVSAREAYLRATSYFRSAEYLAPCPSPRARSIWEKSRSAFHAACKLFQPQVRCVDVNFEGHLLPGYFWRPAEDDERRPTFFAVGGNDDSGEESFFWNGPAAIRRGYNYFTFEYPGHRGAVHLYPGKMIKRADQEKPFAAAFELLETLPGVDDRIALAGYSGGGYVVSRVACFEPRVKALIPVTPLVDAEQAGKAFFNIARLPDRLLKLAVSLIRATNPAVSRLIDYTLWTTGIANITDAKRFIADTTREPMTMNQFAHRITCPVLAMIGSAEGEELFRQTAEFMELIGSERKRTYVFRPEIDGSDDHVQLDNRQRANAVMFDWLDEVLAEGNVHEASDRR